MQRDMSCELDGVFNTRNAGEVQSVAPAKTVINRTPGLVPYTPPNSHITSSNLMGYKTVDAGLFGLGALSDATKQYLTLGVVAAAAAWYFLLRKK